LSVQIKTIEFKPKRNTFGHIERRLGPDKAATRYQEATLDLQATENFHYKPLWEPEFWHFDKAKTAVEMADWYKPLDPRQFYYATYNIARATQQQAVERNFTFAEERSLLVKLPDSAKNKIISKEQDYFSGAAAASSALG
jgi:phenol hydroxylase P1 protein